MPSPSRTRKKSTPTHDRRKDDVKIALLEQGAHQTNELLIKLADRFDLTLVKMHELSQSTTNLLTRHDMRFEGIETQMQHLLTATTKEFSKEVLDSHHTLDDVEATIKVTNDRLDRLERWRWILTGASVVIAAILQFLFYVVWPMVGVIK